MFAEQERYRAWLLDQPPGEILKHAYEYTVREDILLTFEYRDVDDEQGRVLMALEDTLTVVIMAMARIMVILLQRQERLHTMVLPPIKHKLLQVIEWQTMRIHCFKKEPLSRRAI